MAKNENKAQQQDEVDKMNNVLSVTEQWIEDNQKWIITAIVVIIAVVAGYLALRHFYLEPRGEQARAEMYKGEIYLERDSFNLALNGDGGDYLGFKAIADKYSNTTAGNLAKAYAGICCYNLGNNEEALEYFKKYDGDDDIFATNITGMIGNCYANMGEYDLAIKNFVKAADKADNELTSPIFLKKAAVVAENKGDYAKAIKFYEEIKDDYSNSYIGRDIDKYIERAKLLSGK